MAAKNRITRTVKQGSVFEDAKAVIDSTISFDQGDLIYFDDATNLIKKVAAEASCATFLGISPVTVVSGKVKSPYQGTAVDAAQAIESLPGPVHGVIAKLKLKVGDAFNPGDSIYWSADQEISSAGTKAIGIYQGKAVGAAVAGDEGEALLGHRFPGDALICP